MKKTKTMRPMQITYAVQRLDEIANTKLSALKTNFTTEVKPFTVADFIKEVKAGRIKVHPGYEGNDVCRHNYISSIFHIPNRESKFDNKNYEKAAAPIRKEYASIKDKLILGDASDAIKLLEAFATKNF